MRTTTHFNLNNSKTKHSKLLFICTTMVSVMLWSGLVLAQQRATKQTSTKTTKRLVQKKIPAAKKVPKQLTFSATNPSNAILRNKIVQVSPGMHMRVGDYVKASSFKKNATVKNFLSPQFTKRYLKEKPVYREEVVAKGDRLVVKRTLVLKTDNPCDIPSNGKQVSVCFAPKKKAPAKIPTKLKQELETIRKKLRIGKNQPTRFRSNIERRALSRIDDLIKMDDKQLVEYLLNQADDEKTIYHESELALVAESEAIGGGATMIQNDNQLGDVSSEYWNEKLTFERERTTNMPFINGYTWKKGMEDSFEITFCGSTWFTDRYYAKFSYDLSLAVGLRFPFDVEAQSNITHVQDANGTAPYPARSLCQGVTNQQAAIHCAKQATVRFKATPKNAQAADYSKLGIPSDKVFEGNEFIFKVVANARLYASIPGPNFDVDLGHKVQFKNHFTTPMGSSNATLADISIRGKDYGLELSAGALGVKGYAALNPGIRVTGKNGRISMPVTSYKDTATVSTSASLQIPKNSWSQTVNLNRKNISTPTKPWGVVANTPSYTADIVVTPTIAVEIGVEVVYWDWYTTIGPLDIDALSLNLGEFSFQPHEGTPSKYNHYVSGCQGNASQCAASVVYVEDRKPTNLPLSVSSQDMWYGLRDDRGEMVTISNGHWGTWRQADMCLPGTYARAVAVRVESNRGSGDDTALNGIALWCTDAEGKKGNIATSHVGYWGTWGDFTPSCSIQGDFIRAASLKLEGKRGSKDDTAANNIGVFCSNSPIHVAPTNGGKWGVWSTTQSCPQNQFVCGIKTRIEGKQDGDDTTLNGVKFQCCTKQ